MTDKNKKSHRLSVEILLTVIVCFAISAVLFLFVTFFGIGVIDEYCFNNDIVLDEFELYRIDSILMGVGFVVSALVFVVLFLALFGEKLRYVRKITEGVRSLMEGGYGSRVELEGNNELTQLAEAVNYLSERELKIREREKKLNEEKEALIRTLSHDIRTPLTSIMSYTELLEAKSAITPEEQKEYLDLVGKKTAQIKELTGILLDGGKRNPEYFENAGLLFEQLAEEFESELEDEFRIKADVSSLNDFSGSFDVGEMRRVFDNLISNVRKYGDPSEFVEISLSNAENVLVIRQHNGIKKEKQPSESYKLGLNSILRIAQGYGGELKTTEENGIFEIVITFINF